MNLEYKLTGDILEVTETIHSFTKTDRTYWYFNIKTWMRSQHGRKNDSADYPMDQGSIDSVQKYYLPKVLK
jgi:hypothetical protein